MKNEQEKAHVRKTGDSEKRPKRDGFAKRLVMKVTLRITTILVLLCALFFCSRFAFAKVLKVSVARKHALVERDLAEVAELTLYKMRYSDIATIKKKNIIAKAYSIVRYVGTVRAGINSITATEIYISEDGKAIDVILPRSEILGNDITSQEIFDEQRSIFLPITTQEIFDEISNAKEEVVNDLLNEGILEETDERARKLVHQMLARFNFEEINVTTRMPLIITNAVPVE